MKHYTLLFLTLFLSVSYAQEKTLTISENLSWKSVFDDGFHPIWRIGGQTRCQESKVDFSIECKGCVLKLDNGDIQFDVYDDEYLARISYYGRKRYTAVEAKKKVAEFKTILGDSLRPNSEKGMKAWGQIGDYGIYLSFSDSMFDDGTVVSRFGISNRTGETASKIRSLLTADPNAKVQPPEGYEHLSLDPRVVNKEYYDQLDKAREEYNTPEAKAEREEKRRIKEVLRKQAFEKAGLTPKISETEPEKRSSYALYTLLALLGIAGIFIISRAIKK